jgi:hypothetical protein
LSTKADHLETLSQFRSVAEKELKLSYQASNCVFIAQQHYFKLLA